jgi:hypothetical protein
MPSNLLGKAQLRPRSHRPGSMLQKWDTANAIKAQAAAEAST